MVYSTVVRTWSSRLFNKWCFLSVFTCCRNFSIRYIPYLAHPSALCIPLSFDLITFSFVQHDFEPIGYTADLVEQQCIIWDIHTWNYWLLFLFLTIFSHFLCFCWSCNPCFSLSLFVSFWFNAFISLIILVSLFSNDMFCLTKISCFCFIYPHKSFNMEFFNYR